MATIEQAGPLPKLAPGDHIRVTQTIAGRAGRWSTVAEGCVESFRKEPTGSWFAHGKGDKFWLWRVRLTKSDGERTTLTLDANSKIELIPQK